MDTKIPIVADDEPNEGVQSTKSECDKDFCMLLCIFSIIAALVLAFVVYENPNKFNEFWNSTNINS